MGMMPYGGDPWRDMYNGEDTAEEAGAGMCGTHSTSQISGKRNSQGRTLVWSGDDTTQYLAEWSWLSQDSCCHLENISKDE